MAEAVGLRFSEITAHNHQAWLWNISLMSLTFAFLTLGMRLIVKWRMYGTDDLALGAAYILALGHWSTIFAALKEGVGKDATLVDTSRLVEASKLVYVSRVLLLIALAFSKTAMLLFIRNLFTRETIVTWRTCNVLSILTVCWGIGSSLIASVGCSASQQLSDIPNCSAESSRWKAIVAIDIILEALIIALASFLFARLHMRLDRKITVISAFFLRLPIAAIFVISLNAQLHYISTSQTSRASRNASLEIVNPLICFEALICYALLSATIPCLRGFLGRFRTGDLVHVDDSTARYGYGNSNGYVRSEQQQRSGNGFQLRSLKSMKGGSKQDSHSRIEVDERALFEGTGYGHNANGVEHTAIARAGSGLGGSRPGTSEDGMEVQSVGSEELIIHRQTVVEVRRD